jgi:hypothetical protein
VVFGKRLECPGDCGPAGDCPDGALNDVSDLLAPEVFYGLMRLVALFAMDNSACFCV